MKPTTSRRELLKGPLADHGDAIQQAKLRASAVTDLQPRKEYVDAQHWVFKLRKGKPPEPGPSDE